MIQILLQNIANFSVVLININGLSREKFEAISQSVAYTCDIICITETHLNENSDVSYLNLPGYQDIIRLDRGDGTWGVVAIYISNQLYFTRYIITALSIIWNCCGCVLGTIIGSLILVYVIVLPLLVQNFGIYCRIRFIW